MSMSGHRMRRLLSSGGEPEIGDAYKGGFFAGLLMYPDGIYRIIVSDKSAEDLLQWKTANTSTAGTSDLLDGRSNSLAMPTQPAAKHCLEYSAGGFTDWYMPAIYELSLLYRSFKPEEGNNDTFNTANPYMVPPVGDQTAEDPPQTNVLDFQIGGTQAFDQNPYWSSAQFNATNAYLVNFYNGNWAMTAPKNVSRRVRPIRKEKR